MPKTEADSVPILIQLAGLGLTDACAVLGENYFRTKEPGLAAIWFAKGARLGHVFCLYNLGMMYAFPNLRLDNRYIMLLSQDPNHNKNVKKKASSEDPKKKEAVPEPSS